MTLRKTVVNPDNVAIPSTFAIELVCTTEGGTVLDEQLSLAAGATSDSFEVPVGASCDAIEDTSGISNLVLAQSDGPVTIESDTSSLVTVTNTFAGTSTGTPTVVPDVVVSPESVVRGSVVDPPAAVADPVRVAPAFTG